MGARLLIAVLLVCSSGQAANVYRVACGSPGGVDPAGNQWQSDSNFVTGGATWNTAGAPPLPYNHLRFSAPPGAPLSYSFPIAQPGQYSVTLKFVEPNKTGPGLRKFSVAINGTVVLPDLDLFAAAGLSPKDYTFPVVVPGTALSVNLSASVGNAVISGIQIDGPPASPPPGAIKSFTIAFTNQSTVKVPGPIHQLGQALIATCYDSTGVRIQPISMTIDQVTFDVTFGWPTAFSGYCVMIGGSGSLADVACLSWLIKGGVPPTPGACAESGYVAITGPLNAKPGDVIKLPIAVVGVPDTGASAFQWTLALPSGYTATVAPGPPAIAAAKTVACVLDGTKCVLAGTTAATIGNGDVAIYSVQVPPTASGTAVFTLTEWLGATAAGDQAPTFFSFNARVNIIQTPGGRAASSPGASLVLGEGEPGCCLP